jgi:hypothetical protein
MTRRSLILSERYPRRSRPGTEAAELRSGFRDQIRGQVIEGPVSKLAIHQGEQHCSVRLGHPEIMGVG